jgi:hypothetical protein
MPKVFFSQFRVPEEKERGRTPASSHPKMEGASPRTCLLPSTTQFPSSLVFSSLPCPFSSAISHTPFFIASLFHLINQSLLYSLPLLIGARLIPSESFSVTSDLPVLCIFPYQLSSWLPASSRSRKLPSSVQVGSLNLTDSRGSR